MARLISRHLAVLRRADGRLGVATVVTQWILPLAAGVVVWWTSGQMDIAVAGALLTVAGLFAAFSFQLAVQMLLRAAALDDTRPSRSPQTSRDAAVAEMLAGSSAYASLVSLAATGLALGAGLTRAGWPERLFVTLATATLAHMAFTIALLVLRVFALTTAHLRTARASRGESRAA